MRCRQEIKGVEKGGKGLVDGDDIKMFVISVCVLGRW